MRPAYHELTMRGGVGPRSPIVCGRKHCAGCGRWRHVVDYGLHKGHLRARCVTCQKRYNRAWRRAQTPEQRAREREYQRIWHEMRRRAQGIPPRNFHHRRTVIDKLEWVYLQPEPLLVVLRDVEIRTLSRRAHVPERSIDRLLRGESRHVRIDLADKLALAAGLHLSLIYGPDAPVVKGRLPRMAA